jgi:hypothetical protein
MDEDGRGFWVSYCMYFDRILPQGIHSLLFPSQLCNLLQHTRDLVNRKPMHQLLSLLRDITHCLLSNRWHYMNDLLLSINLSVVIQKSIGRATGTSNS